VRVTVSDHSTYNHNPVRLGLEFSLIHQFAAVNKLSEDRSQSVNAVNYIRLNLN
jgi:hypothetical protein